MLIVFKLEGVLYNGSITNKIDPEKWIDLEKIQQLITNLCTLNHTVGIISNCTSLDIHFEAIEILAGQNLAKIKPEKMNPKAAPYWKIKHENHINPKTSIARIIKRFNQGPLIPIDAETFGCIKELFLPSETVFISNLKSEIQALTQTDEQYKTILMAEKSSAEEIAQQLMRHVPDISSPVIKRHVPHFSPPINKHLIVFDWDKTLTINQMDKEGIKSIEGFRDYETMKNLMLYLHERGHVIAICTNSRHKDAIENSLNIFFNPHDRQRIISRENIDAVAIQQRLSFDKSVRIHNLAKANGINIRNVLLIDSLEHMTAKAKESSISSLYADAKLTNLPAAIAAKLTGGWPDDFPASALTPIVNPPVKGAQPSLYLDHSREGSSPDRTQKITLAP